MQWIAVLGGVESGVVECFETGGGVPYEAFDRYHDVMVEESAQTTLGGLVDAILPLVPGGVEALERGIDVLDVGCGRGRALQLMARTFPDSRFTGYDLSAAAVEGARREASEAGLDNLSFEVRDVADLGATAAFDLVTAFDVIHDLARPDLALEGIRAALRPGGTFLMQDIAGSSHLHQNLDHPMAPFMYTISCLGCMTVSLAQDGMGLGTMWGEELAEQMLRDAGFPEVTVHSLEHDMQNVYFLARRPAALS